VNGAYNLEVGLILKLLKKNCNLRHWHIDDFFSEFTWPYSFKNNGKTVFNKRAEDAEGKKNPHP
jgi:hypothetical protein